MASDAELNVDPFRKLIALARHSRQQFQRQVTSAVYHIDEGILATAILQDTFHDMRMVILVDDATNQIADIRAVMLRYPFTPCPEAPEAYRRLIGLKLYEPGTMKKIHQIIPRRDGCTHLYHLLESCLRALFLGGNKNKILNDAYLNDEAQAELTLEQRRVKSMEHPMLKGTCLSFSKPPLEE